MDNIPNTFKDNIKKIYDKSGYLDKYGGSVISCILLLLAFSLVFTYLYILNQIKPIKSDWVNQRCHPSVVPFAGFINAPPGKSKIQFAADNFASCSTDVLGTIIGYFLKPIYFTTSIITKLFGELASSINAVRGIIAHLRNQIDDIVKHILLRLLSTTIPIQKMIAKLSAVLGKIQGIMMTTLLTAMGSYMALRSFIGAFLELVIVALVIASAAIASLWILPFTWPAAAAGTAFFLIISIPVAIIAGWMTHILNISSQSVPGKPGHPSCFDENTLIKTLQGNKKISEIKIGDKINNNTVVTGTFKLSYTGQDVYKLNDVIVTGSHKIFYNNKLIYVKHHPNVQKISYNKEFVYCINTSNKRIKINNLIFADWDEITDEDIAFLKNINLLPKNKTINDIHKYLDGGFEENTLIELEDGRSKKIKNIDVNEQLKFGERVLGIVKIDAENLLHVKKYYHKKQEFIGGVNLQLYNTLGETSTLYMQGEPIIKPKYLYNLITDAGIFSVNGIKFYDYNGCNEQILDAPKNLLKIF